MAQKSPHEKELRFDCSDCHTTEGWKYSGATAKFSHDSVGFMLTGQHRLTGCKSCHTDLKFKGTRSSCIDCHADLHRGTVGMDCAQCHTPVSWLVTNITELHQNSRFPLVGAHRAADCSSCHSAVSLLEFQPLGILCIDCHRSEYETTTRPNHRLSGISEECSDCHRVEAFEWSAGGFNHDFFPLTLGHNIDNCTACHTSGFFEPVSTDCFACHQNDYSTAVNPNHKQPGFTTVCLDCHTTEPDWKPARFDIHDSFFPVYSGEHRGEWDRCTDCHIQPDNYSVFSCTNCHEHNKSEMDDKHRGVNGYTYASAGCLSCHPNGSEND